MSAVLARSLMSIGEVLDRLRPEFSDITISKIRFLEAEGLIEPARTPSGYRRFSFADMERLRYVLTVQRDQYLPLRVIKEQLEAIDRGLQPPTSSSTGPRAPRPLVVAPQAAPEPEAFRSGGAIMRLTRDELAESADLTGTELGEVESAGLISPRAGGHYDADALEVANTVAALRRFGIEGRHLRAFKAASDREVGLIEQVAGPLRVQRDPAARARAGETARELASLVVRLHAALVRAGLDPALRD